MAGGDPLRRCVAVVRGNRAGSPVARFGERCRCDGSVHVGEGEYVCGSHHRHGWDHFERAATADGMAERMRAVREG